MYLTIIISFTLFTMIELKNAALSSTASPDSIGNLFPSENFNKSFLLIINPFPTGAVNYVVRAFNQSYQDPSKLIDRFHKFVLNQWDLYSTSTNPKYLAPYLALFQSSGYGKSRLLKELASREWMFYISFARTSSTVLPSRSPIIADWLCECIRTLNTDDRWFFAFWSHCVGYLQIQKKNNPHLTKQEWFEQLLPDKSDDPYSPGEGTML